MTNDNQHIPSGYKPSPLGPIPEDWEVKRLGEICTHFKSGNTITSIDIHDDGLYPVYGGNGLRGYANTFTHDGNYILIGRQGALCGNINYVEGKNYISEHAIAVQTNENMQWLKYKLENWNLNRFSESSAQPGLSVEKLVRYKLVIPTRLEQNKIADILQLWDTAIAKQTALIEQLTLRKRGLMQQLLTGKKRLKGFEGEWKEVRLGDVALVIGGGTPNTNIPDYWDGDIPWFTPSEIGENKYVNISKRTITEKGLNDSSAKILPKGTILFTSRATIGAKAILTTEATTNQGFQSLVVINGNNNEFIYYYLDIIINEIKQKASGSTFPEVSAESIRKTTIKIPNVTEQNAIASVLVNADKEIEIQKQKLAALQEQKKGLMQVLLTGKRRTK